MPESGFLNQLEPKEIQRQLSRIPLYIRLLSLGKLAAGGLVVLLVAVVVLVPFLKSEDDGVRIALTQQPLVASADKPVMKNPRFESVDGANQPYTVRALEAVQQDESRVILSKINADVALNSGLWLALSAEQGEMDITKQALVLNEKVHVIASNGYELRAPQAYVDIKTSRATGTKGVEGQGPMGNIRADEFLIEGESQRVLFEKNVKLTIYP